MSNATVARRIKSTDELISQFEAKTISALESSMDAAFQRLEREFRRKWVEVEGLDISGQNRAILLLEQIKNYLEILPGDSANIDKLYEDLVTDCQVAGIDFGASAIESITGFAAATVKPNLKAIAYQSQDASKRLYRHSTDFQLAASRVIEQGLVGGSGVAKVAEQLRRELGVTKSKAETIARTESMSAMDSATRDTYRKNGIEYVQRIGTQDDRICPICAARVGNVYPVDKAVGVIHPRDRCWCAPFSPAWVEMGLVDMEWLQNHRAESIAALGGKSPDYGPSPFERMAGQLPIKPIWTVDRGFAAGFESIPQQPPEKAKKQPKKQSAKPAKPKEPAVLEFPSSLDGLKEIKKLGGSTGALLVEDSSGNRFVKKTGANRGHILEESLADDLYRKMGVPVPDHRMYEDADGKPVKLARFVEGESFGSLTGEAKRKASIELQKHFAIDALMGNWDVLGLSGDNVLVDKNGKVWRIDNGGSLRYRAMGAKKGDAWNEHPTELWSLRDSTKNNTQSPAAFSGLDWYEVVDQIEEIKLPKFAKADSELGKVLESRLAEMRRTAKISRTMQQDQWKSSYVEPFAKHGMGYRAAGIVGKLSDSMAIQSFDYGYAGVLDTPVDSEGRPFDNIRHSDVKGMIDKYYKDNGLDYSLVDRYRRQQGGSSWSEYPMALKSLLARSRGGDPDRYYWDSGIGEADRLRTMHSTSTTAWEESMIAAHAWTYEQLSKIDMPSIDRRKGTIQLWRTEGSYLESAYGLNVNKKQVVGGDRVKRGALESTSMFAPISAVAGTVVTTQNVPIHRVFADYMLQKSEGGSGFANDTENEATAILDGIDWEIRPDVETGHKDPEKLGQKTVLKYDPSNGVVAETSKSKPEDESLDDLDDIDLDDIDFMLSMLG